MSHSSQTQGMDPRMDPRMDRAGGPQRAPIDEEDFEIEVVPLEDMRHELPHGPQGREPLHSPFGARLTPRRRIVAALVAGGSVLLALVIIITTLPDAQTVLRQALHLPVAPTLADGSQVFLLDDTVPWGTLRVDGQSVTDEQLTSGLPTGYEAIHLAAGRHTLNYVAEHFSPLTCTTSVPRNPGDTCPFATEVAPDKDLKDLGVLDLRASPGLLVQADKDRLINALNAALPSQSTALLPGERYVDANGQIVDANQPLTGTLHLIVNTDPTHSLAMPDGVPCISLCSAGLGSQLPSQWTILANVSLSWTFDAGGRPVGSSSDTLGLGKLAHLLPVTVVSQPSGWQDGGSGSETVAHVLFSALGDSVRQHWSADPLGAEFPSGWTVVPFIAPNPADGCMLDIGTPSPLDGLPAGDTIEVLYRFGVVLAANDHAHKSFPQLPVATAAELQRWRSVLS